MEVTWDASAYNGIAGYRIYYSELALPSDMDQWRRLDVGPYTVAQVIVTIILLKVHGHGQTHSCNFCRFKLDI